jgi:hypothetical protein
MTTKLRTILGVVIAVGIAAAIGIWAQTATTATKAEPTAVKASAAVINPFGIMKSGKDLSDTTPTEPF